MTAIDPAGETQPRLRIFTSAAVNYLPKVRTRCRSVRRHHPEAVIGPALADERPAWVTVKGEPFDDVIEISAPGTRNWRPWTFKHNIVVLSTATKPFVFKHLFRRADCERAPFCDPDMALFSGADDILRSLDGTNIALTPCRTKPEKSCEAIVDNEISRLKWVAVNGGFIGVRNAPESRRFLDWRSGRTYRLCRADVAETTDGAIAEAGGNSVTAAAALAGIGALIFCPHFGQ